MNEPRYVAGYGSTKHILDTSDPHMRPFTSSVNDGYGLCGAYGGYPLRENGRPVCKRCERIAARVDSGAGR